MERKRRFPTEGFATFPKKTQASLPSSSEPDPSFLPPAWGKGPGLHKTKQTPGLLFVLPGAEEIQAKQERRSRAGSPQLHPPPPAGKGSAPQLHKAEKPTAPGLENPSTQPGN